MRVGGLHSMRPLRSFFSTGLMWAIAWTIVGLAIAPFFPARIGTEFERYLRSAFAFAFVGSGYGFLAGSIFAASVGITGRVRTLDALSIAKFAAGSATLSLLLTVPAVGVVLATQSVRWTAGVVAAVVSGALLCAVSTAATLGLAKRGARIEHAQFPLDLRNNSSPAKLSASHSPTLPRS